MNIVLFIFYIFFKYVLLKIVRSIPTSIKNYFKILFKVVFYPIICSFHILEKGNLNQIGKILKIWCIFSIFLFYIFGYLMMPEHAVTSGYFAFALLLIAPSIKSELLTRKKKEIIFSAFKTHIVGSIMIIIMTYLFFLLKCGTPELISLMLAIIIGAIIIAAIVLSPKAILYVLTDKDFQTTCKKTINDKIEEFIINKIK